MSSPKAPCARGRKPRPVVEPDFLYAAMHDTNLALSIGSGFFGPRYEQSAAKDHHARAGSLMLSNLPLSAADELAARGDLDYGTVGLVELEGGIRQVPVGSAGLPVPIALARRLIFRSAADLKAFAAKLSSYEDLPSDAIPLAVEPSLFGKGSEAGLLTSVETEAVPALLASVETEAVPAVPSQASIQLDKIAGSAAALFLALRSSDPGLAANLANLTASTVRDSPLASFISDIVERLDQKHAETKASKVLLAGIVEQLRGLSASSGFSASAFVNAIHPSTEADIDAPETKTLAVWLKRFADIVGLRAELPDDAYEYKPGLVVARALLLFLLNPDADKLQTVRQRSRNLGDPVFAVAAMFAGCRVGMSHLTPAVKAPSRATFHGLSMLAWNLCSGKPFALEVQQEYLDDGSSRQSVVLDSYHLVEHQLPASPALQTLATSAESLGSVSIDGKNALVRLLPKLPLPHIDALQLRWTEGPSFPREPSVLVEATLTNVMTRKALDDATQEICHKHLETGVFARSLDAPRRAKRGAVGMVLYAYCSASSSLELGLSQAVRAISERASQLPKPNAKHEGLAATPS